MYLLIIAAPQIIETVVSGGMTAGEIAAICLAATKDTSIKKLLVNWISLCFN
jgi:hypothetical protein